MNTPIKENIKIGYDVPSNRSYEIWDEQKGCYTLTWFKYDNAEKILISFL